MRSPNASSILATLLLATLSPAPGLAGPPVHIDPKETAKVCQVLGEFDRQIMRPTVNRTETQAKFWGSDLGPSFEHDGKLYVLFGDTHPVPGIRRQPDADSIATSETRDPQDCLRLSFFTAEDGGFRPIEIPGVYSGAFAVPTGGFSLNGSIYMLAASDAPGKGPAGRSVLARSDDDGWTFRRVYDLSTEHLVNVSPALVEPGAVPNLPPHEGQGILFFGASGYRRSDPRLAYMPAGQVEDKSALRFFAGMDPSSGHPRWSADEAESVPLFNHGCVGEFSAGWNPYLSKWMLLYTCGGQRATTFLRTADWPWGPWSAPETLFDPARDTGDCGFLNPAPTPAASNNGRNCPVVSDPHTPMNPGESYGPYIISRFTSGEPGRWSTIHYLMSTWNPYTVVLMRSTLRVGADGEAQLSRPAGLSGPPAVHRP